MAMNIVITGAGGFIGKRLSAALVEDAAAVSSLVLVDLVEPPAPVSVNGSKVRVKCVKADLTDASACRELFSAPGLTHVYLLHGIMSSQSESEFELGRRVNVHSTLQILEVLASRPEAVTLVYTSTSAVYGPILDGQPVTEATQPQPSTSYGSQKLMMEIMLADLARRNLVDGRIVRLPTVIVRPGAPSQAASSFCSGIFREPLSGKPCVLPVARDYEIWVCSTRTLVANLLHARDVPHAAFEGSSRVVNLPGFTASVQQMLDALEAVGGSRARALVREQPDPTVARILHTWAPYFDVAKARALGFADDGSLEEAVRDFAREELHS